MEGGREGGLGVKVIFAEGWLVVGWFTDRQREEGERGREEGQYNQDEPDLTGHKF